MLSRARFLLVCSRSLGVHQLREGVEDTGHPVIFAALGLDWREPIDRNCEVKPVAKAGGEGTLRVSWEGSRVHVYAACQPVTVCQDVKPLDIR